MSELSGTDNFEHSPEGSAKKDLDVNKGEFETEVEGIFADGKKGNLHVFDVSNKEFFDNMKMDRKRLRFSSDSNASKYMRSTKYNIPFYIRNKESGYLRKIK